MKSSLKPSAIQFDAFKANLDTYQSLIPNTLDELEDFRFHEIPELLGSRQADGEAFLEKAEVSKLIEWKLCVEKISVVCPSRSEGILMYPTRFDLASMALFDLLFGNLLHQTESKKFGRRL